MVWSNGFICVAESVSQTLPSNVIIDKKPEGLFYTEGSDELRKFRIDVAKFSLYRAQKGYRRRELGRGMRRRAVICFRQ